MIAKDLRTQSPVSFPFSSNAAGTSNAEVSLEILSLFIPVWLFARPDVLLNFLRLTGILMRVREGGDLGDWRRTFYVELTGCSWGRNFPTPRGHLQADTIGRWPAFRFHDAPLGNSFAGMGWERTLANVIRLPELTEPELRHPRLMAALLALDRTSPRTRCASEGAVPATAASKRSNARHWPRSA